MQEDSRNDNSQLIHENSFLLNQNLADSLANSDVGLANMNNNTSRDIDFGLVNNNALTRRSSGQERMNTDSKLKQKHDKMDK